MKVEAVRAAGINVAENAREVRGTPPARCRWRAQAMYGKRVRQTAGRVNPGSKGWRLLRVTAGVG